MTLAVCGDFVVYRSIQQLGESGLDCNVYFDRFNTPSSGITIKSKPAWSKCSRVTGFAALRLRAWTPRIARPGMKALDRLLGSVRAVKS
jgi:hypothetical protein